MARLTPKQEAFGIRDLDAPRHRPSAHPAGQAGVVDMIPAMHRRGRHWPTMGRPVPQRDNDRAGSIGNAVIAWLAFVALVAIAIVAPVL